VAKLTDTVSPTRSVRYKARVRWASYAPDGTADTSVLNAERLPAASSARTAYRYAVPVVGPGSAWLVTGPAEASGDPSRYGSYPVTPSMSVLPVQVSATEVNEALAARPVGTDGATVSTVQVVVAGVGSLMPFAVAATVKAWLPWLSPV
jgi:hypothetical protein